jgi:hypothetical protein
MRQRKGSSVVEYPISELGGILLRIFRLQCYPNPRQAPQKKNHFSDMQEIQF